MNKLSSRDKVISILSIALLLSLFGGVYFLYIQPKQNEIDNKVKQLKTEEQLLSVIQNKISETNSSTFESTTELQKLVPVKLLTEKLLLQIEKAEVISDSFIINMDFGDGELTELTEEVDSETEIEVDLEEKGNENDVLNNTIPLPSGVKKVTVNLTVESPSYYELEKFIQAIEGNERITVVEKIDFTGTEEITNLEQPDEPLTYTLSISAFYMPMLTDLINELPQIDAPKPSKKKNPLNSFSDFTDSEDTEEAN
ncbi:pilus assembly protein PilO (plasmid) [Bacillus sp. 31A1R]|uniref:Pilus assembly protein PilO n=1 Tax=Robertmurraya mangrovi TaxID=3098077 RepID=A0ABU5IUI9_9BACI|nr:pilus assembly protein PilO [Bacillus sp. 31A1R]MDZ5470811.1 pilus assembly protein PilO [Bacillus sp. 31A1R]